MSQSLSRILIHVVFTTKDRQRFLDFIGPGQLDDLVGYISNQRDHHKNVSFQDEYRGFLDRYGIAYDERHVWD